MCVPFGCSNLFSSHCIILKSHNELLLTIFPSASFAARTQSTQNDVHIRISNISNVEIQKSCQHYILIYWFKSQRILNTFLFKNVKWRQACQIRHRRQGKFNPSRVDSWLTSRSSSYCIIHRIGWRRICVLPFFLYNFFKSIYWRQLPYLSQILPFSRSVHDQIL